MKKTINKAWLSGYFDGEGSLYISAPTFNLGGSHRRGALLRVNITQADKRSLVEIQKEYGGTLGNWVSKETGKTYTKLEFRNTQNIKVFLEDIFPYSREKRLQIECALSYLELPWRQHGCGGARKRLTDDQMDIDMMYSTEIKYLKPGNWKDYNIMENDDDIMDFAFGKVCELHPETEANSYRASGYPVKRTKAVSKRKGR